MLSFNYQLSEEEIFLVLKQELGISQSFEYVSARPLKDLHICEYDVNLALCVLEWRYLVDIHEGDISLSMTVKELISNIIQNLNYLNKAS